MTTSSTTKMAGLKNPSKQSKLSSSKISPLNKPALLLEKKILSFVHQEHLWHCGDTLVVTVSGGPDSVALFFFLLRLAKKEQLKLIVAHVNYQLRGQDSQADEELVKQLASSYGLPCHILRAPKKRSDEAILRQIRYDFFAQIQKKEKAQAVVLAHHQDDQAETFLLQLFRGSGTTGLKAMLPKRDFYVRPFLQITRQEILAYLKRLGAQYNTDKSNTDTRYMRNRIRHELLPLLEEKYQPNIKASLARTARLIQKVPEETQLQTIVCSVLERKTSCNFNQAELLSLKQTVRLSFLRQLIKEKTGKTFSYNQMQELEKCIKSTKKHLASVVLPGLKLTRKGDTVTLRFSSSKD